MYTQWVRGSRPDTHDSSVANRRSLSSAGWSWLCTTYSTFFATAGTIANNGATPVFVDVDPKTYNMDTHLLEAAITPRTKAVVAVSLFGQCCDMPTIKAICDKHQLFLIEDAAQSIGSEWEGKRSGSMSDFGTFSFFPSKNLGGAGDGGMIVTQSAELAEKSADFKAILPKWQQFRQNEVSWFRVAESALDNYTFNAVSRR